MQRSIFIFRRDLRLEDNLGLIQSLKHSKEVYGIFILDPRQLEPHPYLSINAKQFLFNSLKELDSELKKKNSKLHIFHGNTEQILDSILKESTDKNLPIDSVFINRDYTPFSTKRDESLLEVCKANNCHLVATHDALLTEPHQSVKADGKPYTVFTPFFKKNSKILPPKPVSCSYTNFSNLENSKLKPISILDELLTEKNKHIFKSGGRKEGTNLIQNKIEQLLNYNDTRNLPSVDGTSGLSAHHKFGTVSIRETFWKAKQNLPESNNFISELYWRDFFTTIGYFFPHVFSGAFHKKYDNLRWDDPLEKFDAWRNGMTGFPIVDAGMRELNSTGFMHNRVRMITSSFLIKDLHIDWREGEKYFATQLVDYDPAVNNGSWQWSSSTGCDAQPYFRIFNPALQQQKFDPDCLYIKKWIPELIPYTAKQIHGFEQNTFINYPPPIIIHSNEKKETERRYAEVTNLPEK